MGNLTTKKVEVMLKNKLDMAGMATELGITVDEVESELKRLYHEDTLAKIKRRIKGNEKVAKKHEPKVEHENQEPVEEIVEVTTCTAEEVSEDINTSVPEAKPEFDFVVEANLTIDEVQASIDDKTTQLASLERKHQTSASNRSSIKSRIAAKKNELERMQARIKTIEAEVETMITEFDSEEVKMKEFTLQIAQTRDAIEKLNLRRAELETLYILVYSNGSIEINNELLPQENIPNTWEAIYHDFYGKEALDALTGFEQKNLAKFFALLKVLPGNRKKDVCFENNDMQAAYENLKGGILN